MPFIIGVIIISVVPLSTPSTLIPELKGARILVVEDNIINREIARELLQGKHGVGRVIARPFITENGVYKRTANRRDFSIEPSGKTVLDALYESKFDVISVGKIYDIFAHRGINEYHLTFYEHLPQSLLTH